MFQLSVVMLSLLNLVWPAAQPSVSERWHAWPVTRVFPATLPGTSPSGATVTYVLTGIAREAPCIEAFQAAAARALPGCRTALRATYADGTQTFVATIGIAVLDGSGARAPLAGAAQASRPPSVLPVAFPGGPAERFGLRQYITGAVSAAADRYVVLVSAGYADGRPYLPGITPAERLEEVARQLAAGAHRVLTR